MSIPIDDITFTLNLVGTVVFALDGALEAIRKKLDLFGVAVIALVTAIGGGTIRDITLGRYPVFWMQNPLWLLTSLGSALLAVLFYRHLSDRRMGRLLVMFDALGLTVFAVSGVWITYQWDMGPSVEVNPGVIILMGVVTGCAGGVMRDMLCNEQPMILRKEIYATAALLTAAAFYVGLELGMDPFIAGPISCALGFALRMMALRYGWSLRYRPGRRAKS